MSTHPRQYHAQLVDLKEALISGDAEDLIQKQILNKFQEQRELSKSYKPPVEQEVNSSNPVDYIDYYKLNDDLYVQDSENKKMKYNDPYAFFKQSTNQILRPISAIKYFCKHPTDPDTFATITAASKFFRNKQFQLKELICLEDYKKLTKLRVVNFIYLLRIITKIDESLYQEVKDRLLMLKDLCIFLDLISEYYQTDIKMVYKRLETNTQIHDLEVQDEEKKVGADYEDFIFEDQDEEDNAQQEISEKFDEGQFYKEYFSKSSLSQYQSENFSNNLLNEEEKWQVRAKWIEQIIAKFRKEKPQWIPWIEAKVNALVDLDVIVNQKQNEFCTNNQVFYLQEFLEEQLRIQNSKLANKQDQEAFLKDKYTHEQQVQIDEINVYPSLKFVTTTASNDNAPAWECTVNIRQKFCLKILHQEIDTDYFLQVFKRRNFGNEKVYEKRLNLRGRALFMRRFEFQQDLGNHIFLSFVTKQIEPTMKPEKEVKEAPLIEEEEKLEDDDNADENKDKNEEVQSDNEIAEDLGENYTYGFADQGYEYQANDEVFINEDLRSENGENEGQKISLVFSIDSQFKDPLLVKPNSQFLGFFGDKNFLSYKKVKIQVKIPSKDQNEEQKIRNQSALRIFEHDLHSFQKVKAIDLLAPYSKVTRADIINKRFGRTKDGFYYIFEKQSKKDNDSNKTFVFLRNREEIPIVLTDKIPKAENKNNKTMLFIEKFYPNEKGDKLLMQYRKDEKFQFARFTLDNKDLKNKKYKQDVFDFKNIKEFLGDDQAKIKSIIFRILPINNDFLIIIQKVGKETGEVFIYLNDTLLCSTQKTKDHNFSTQDISYGLNQNLQLSKIYCQATNIYSSLDLKNFKKQVYQVFEINQLKKEWYTQSYSILNQDVTFAFPHMFFIYNHDQLYMKDLTKPELEGYYYMNNFIGIKHKNRPLCVQSYRFKNSIVINVPITEAKYQDNQFFLRVNSIQTNSCANIPYQLYGNIIKYQVYTMNEKCSEVSSVYAKLILNAEGKLEKDLRIYNKDNSLYIEKWDKNICIQRALITQYTEADLSNRDVTRLINNTTSDENATVEEKFKSANITLLSYCERFITIQKRESVQIWKFNQSYFGYGFIDYNFEDIFTCQWEYSSDEINNQIQDIIIDTMPKGKVDFYLLQSLGYMKKISYQIEQGTFNEHPFIYKIDKIFNDQNFQFGQSITIANQILYYDQSMIDLNAEVFLADKKTQQGFELSKLQLDYYFRNIPQYSGDNGLLLLSDEGGADYNAIEEQQLIAKSITLPLYNSRMLPQFQQTQFNHPIVPLVNLNQGYVVVFSLNLSITLNDSQYSSDSQINIMLHETSQIFRYTNNHNVSPGLLLRYFNGVEQRLPIQEKIIQVDRFTISRDGFNIVIQGMSLQEKVGDSKLEIMNGLFIYKIDKDDITKIRLVQFIPFATITPPPQAEERQLTRYDFGKSEIDTEIACIGQTSNDYIDYYPSLTATDYKETFKPEELEQSEDENEDIGPNFLPNKLKSYLSLVKEKQISNQTQEAINIKKVPRFQGKNLSFPKFDLPAPQDTMEVFNKLQKVYNTGIPRYVEYTGEKIEGLERLEKVHNNLKIIVNENGHLFLINRSSNKVCFFHQKQQQKPLSQLQQVLESDNQKELKYQLSTFVLQGTIIEGADSSGNQVILWSKDNFIVYDFSTNTLIDCLNSSHEIISTGQANDYIKIKSKPKQRTLSELLQPQKEVEPYLFEIIECKLNNGKIIFKVQEQINVNNPTNYLKIFDLKKQVLLNYFEYDQLMISGDKKFIWLPVENKVYDIENNLSTLFLWPGGQFNSQGSDAMDVFNISEDRSIMATHGILYQAFSMHSCEIQTQRVRDVVPETNDYMSRNLEFFYNLPGSVNIIDSILNDNAELSRSFKASSQATNNDKINLENQIWRENLIANLNNYINKNGAADKNNFSNYAHFLLSYYDDVNPQELRNIFEVLYSHQQPRVDIIEDILNTVVQDMVMPITKCVVNKSFLDFLQNADTSQSFKLYLDKSISQTALMIDTQKYPITSNAQGFTVGQYASPIMDEDFHKQYQGINESKKDVTIQYIFLGDLLVDKGDKILDCLNDIKYLSILNIPFLNYIVQFQWKSVQNEIKLKTLYPFFMLLFLFTIYTMWFVSYIDDVSSITTDSPILHIIAYYTLIVLQISMVGYFILVEIKQFLKDKIEYISSFWNYTDLLINSFCLSVFILDIIGGMQYLLRPIASSTLIIVWVKLFYYMRAYDSTSQLIRMIIETVKDIRYFLFVLLIGIVGFAGGFYILQFGLATVPKDSDAEGHQFVGTNPLLAVIYIYQLVMGNFNLGNFGEYEGLNKFEFYFIWFLFVVSCLFLVIVLMNLLIAIMGSTFQKVQDSILNLSIRENILLISENESLFQRQQIFKTAQFLIIITEKQNSGSQAATVDEQISSLKKELVNKVTLLENQVSSSMVDTQKDLKRKFQDQQEKQKMSFSEAETSYNATLKKELDNTLAKMNEMFSDIKQQSVSIEKQVTQFNEKIKMIEDISNTIEGIKNNQLKGKE